MSHIEAWLDAYLDGELDSGKSVLLEKHLAGCQHCQELLAERRLLSSLLQDVPPAEGLLSEPQFVADVRRQIRQQERAQKSGMQLNRALRLGWQLAPVGLLLAFIFLQTVAALSAVLTFIPGVEQLLGLEPAEAAQLPGLLESGWTALALDWLGLEALYSLVNWNGIANLITLAGIGLLYLGWMASWWVRTQRNGTKTVVPSQSNGFHQTRKIFINDL